MNGLDQISEDLYQVSHRIKRLMILSPGANSDPLPSSVGLDLLGDIKTINDKVDELIVDRVEVEGLKPKRYNHQRDPD